MTTLALAAAPSATQAVVTVSAIPGGAASMQFQIAGLADFKFCMAPRFTSTLDSPATIAGLNQRSNYYLRARALDSNGAPIERWSAAIGLHTADGTAQDLGVPSIMITPALVIVPDPVLSWSADNEILGYPAAALGRDDPTSVWASAQAGGMVAVNAQVAGSPIDTIALLGTTFPEDTQVMIKAGPSLASVTGSTPAYSFGPTPFRASPNVPGRPRGYHGLFRLPAAQSYPYWRVELTGSAAGGITQATHMVLGRARAAKNYTQGKTEDVADLGTLSRDRNGIPNRALGYKMRTVAFDISLMTEADWETKFQTLRDLVGLTQPVLLVPNSKAGAFLHDRILYGTLSQKKTSFAAAPVFTESLTISSLI